MVSTYANKVLADSFNLAPGLSYLIADCGGAEYALCSLLSVLLIEGLGRRRAFMWTASGMAICFAIIAGLSPSGNHTQQPVAASFSSSSIPSSVLAWVGDPFLYSAEIAPLRCRAQANVIASAGNWVFCFVVVMIVPPRNGKPWLENVHHVKGKEKLANLFPCSIFAIFNAVFVPIIYFFLVEMKKSSLEELDVMFGNPVRKEKVMPHDLSVAESRRILELDAKYSSSEEDFKMTDVRVEKV